MSLFSAGQDDRAFAALVTHGVLTPKEGAPQEAPPTGLKLAAVHAAIGSLRDRVVVRLY